MSDIVEELLLQSACETPLPRSSSASRKTGSHSSTKLCTRAQAMIEPRAGPVQEPSLHFATPNKKRSRQPKFVIFVDADTAKASFTPLPKKLKSDVRVPLAIRTDYANLTPIPSRHYPDTTFPFSPFDPLWENVENYDTRSLDVTPPSTPRSSSPTPSPSSGSSPHASPHSPGRAARTHQAQRTTSQKSLPPPKDMTLYEALDLKTWRVSGQDIKAAHRKYAREHHPDKVLHAQRVEATHLMQIANAAAEVLLNSKRRRAYHKSGRLPWAT